VEELEQLGIVPMDVAVLRSLFPSYRFSSDKILALEDAGKLIRLKKGMYVVSPDVSGELLSVELIANHLYGPSYVSMESALRYYGLIPEKVFTVRSATIARSRKFENSIATFQYISVNEGYYSIGINQKTIENKYTFLIASPEKALCDLIVTTPRLNFQSVKAVETYLADDLRLDMSAFAAMNKTTIEQCVATGKKRKALELLLKLLSR
jgi:hypothetical protein